MIDLKNQFPEAGKRLSVLMNGSEYEAYLFGKDWHFSSREHKKLKIKTMKDHVALGEKITHWRYKN